MSKFKLTNEECLDQQYVWLLSHDLTVIKAKVISDRVTDGFDADRHVYIHFTELEFNNQRSIICHTIGEDDEWDCEIDSDMDDKDQIRTRLSYLDCTLSEDLNQLLNNSIKGFTVLATEKDALKKKLRYLTYRIEPEEVFPLDECDDEIDISEYGELIKELYISLIRFEELCKALLEHDHKNK